MALLPARTFRGKLRLLVIGSCVISSVVVAAALIVAFYRELERSAIAENRSETRMLNIWSEAPLAFDDPKAGLETLRALQAVPAAVGGWIYRTDRSLLSKFEPADIPDLPPSEEQERVEGHLYVITQRVLVDGEFRGWLVVAYDISPLRERLRNMILVAGLCALAATLLSAALGYRLQRRLARPMAELSTTARRVAESGDYSLRATKFEPDEFGEFTDRFNQMLYTIQRQSSELTVTNNELRQKNAEMEQFTYTVSHDLKNPIVTIKGFVGMLKEDIAAGNSADIDDSIMHITRAADRMTQLINELLELSRIGRVTDEREQIDVTAMVHDLVMEMSEQVESCGAQVVVESMPSLYAEAMRVRQVFDNLLSNALKYGCTGEDRTVTIGGYRRGSESLYFVRDRGKGIDPTYHQRIFGLFQRLENRTEGTGIGLAIVARVAETHGGRVWVESTPGNGATFWVLFTDVTGSAEPQSTGISARTHDAFPVGRG